jgi:hypothetical protein
LADLRQEALDTTIGPGAITKLAQELDVRRDTLSRLLAPGSIRLLKKLESHLEV